MLIKDIVKKAKIKFSLTIRFIIITCLSSHLYRHDSKAGISMGKNFLHVVFLNFKFVQQAQDNSFLENYD
jgi:hypothetical protein